MIAADANILLYAYNDADTNHQRAKEWLKGQLSGSLPFGLSWHIITAFLRISTNHRIFPRPLSREDASGTIDSWLACECVEILAPTSRHWQIFQEMIKEGQTAGPLMMDAHLAALCIEHNATLATNDRDFTRFPGLRTINPLRN